MNVVEMEVEALPQNWIEFWAGYIASCEMRLRTAGVARRDHALRMRIERKAVCGDDEENLALWDAARDFLDETKLTGPVRQVVRA